MSAGIEWGYSYRLAKHPLRSGPGRGNIHAAGSREEAQSTVSEFLNDEPGHWEASLVWRTAAVEAGSWQDGEPPAGLLPPPAVSLEELPEGYIFSFSVESPLAGRYVALKGDRDETRALMNRMFGTRWAEQRRPSPGTLIIARRGWKRLLLGIEPEEGFDPEASAAVLSRPAG